MATSSSETAFLTLEKSLNYRGAREHWANVYHLDQVPPDATAWAAIASAIEAKEMTFLDADVQFERRLGHNPGTPPVLVYQVDYAPPGEGGPTGAFTPLATEHLAPGDAAGWIRYGTTQKTSLGKPIYLRNYYHQIYVTADGDTIAQRQHDAMGTLGAMLVAGIQSGAVTYRRAGPRGAVAQNYQVGTFATTRTLKARGRRHRITAAQLKAAYDAGKANDVPFILGPAFP